MAQEDSENRSSPLEWSRPAWNPNRPFLPNRCEEDEPFASGFGPHGQKAPGYATARGPANQLVQQRCSSHEMWKEKVQMHEYALGRWGLKQYTKKSNPSYFPHR